MRILKADDYLKYIPAIILTTSSNHKDVLECYRHNISREHLFSWYNWCLGDNCVNISLKNYSLSPQKRKEENEKYLERLRQRVVDAEETLKKEIEEYERRMESWI